MKKREELGEVFEQYKDRVLMFARRMASKIPKRLSADG